MVGELIQYQLLIRFPELDFKALVWLIILHFIASPKKKKKGDLKQSFNLLKATFFSIQLIQPQN